MKRMEALEKKYQKIASKTTKELDGMSVSELKALRGNMVGWLEAATGDTAIVIGEDGKRELKQYDMAAVEFALRQVETEIAWRECEEAEHKPDPLDGVPFVSLSNEEIAAMTPDHPLYKLVKGKEERNGQ